jgi:alpha-tubulin suppressor-like RCC1 family protein
LPHDRIRAHTPDIYLSNPETPMRRCALLVLPGVIAGSVVAMAQPAAAYTPSVKPHSVTIASTTFDSVFIAADGRAYGVGNNLDGEITGASSRTSPAPLTGLPAGVRATAVSASFFDVLVLGSNGTAYGAGQNTSHELTGADTANKTTLTPMTGLPAGVTAAAVAMGYDFSVVLGSNGKVYGSGDNGVGQLTGATNPTTTLTAMTGLPSGVKATAVAAGAAQTVVLGSDHRAYGTGFNFDGDLSGPASTYSTLTPFTDLPLGVHVVSIAAGFHDDVLLMSDQHAYVFGTNEDGELGIGSTDSNPHARGIRVPVDNVVAISAGYRAVVVVDAAGVAFGAGANTFGELTGTPANNLTFAYLSITTGARSTAQVVEAAVGESDTLVRDADGVVLGSGDNSYKQLTGLPTQYTSMVVLHGQKVISYVKPSITGTRKVGHTLAAHVGSFSVEPTHYAYQWMRNGSSISHATKSTYKLTTSDKAKHISVRVTGSRSGGFARGSATSLATAAIAPA